MMQGQVACSGAVALDRATEEEVSAMAERVRLALERWGCALPVRLPDRVTENLLIVTYAGYVSRE